MWDVQLVENDVKQFDVIARRLAIVIQELVGRQFPVTDNDKRSLLVVPVRQLRPTLQAKTQHGEEK